MPSLLSRDIMIPDLKLELFFFCCLANIKLGEKKTGLNELSCS